MFSPCPTSRVRNLNHPVPPPRKIIEDCFKIRNFSNEIFWDLTAHILSCVAAHLRVQIKPVKCTH